MKYDAVVFLAGLFRPGPCITVADLRGDWRVAFEERAGIMEYHGNLPRCEAERRALAEIEKNRKRTARYLTSSLSEA